MKKLILLIEDNPEMRENISEILELANYDVATAENGRKGVEMAKKLLPNLILCDVMMPEMDGYGVLYLLGKSAETAAIPFIFLTAKAEKSDLRKGMNLGADDYLTKPFEEMELLDAIETRLKRQELFQSEFRGTEVELNQFISDAKSLEYLNKISTEKKVKNIKKKNHLYYEGDKPTGLIFIQKGKIKTFKINDDGKEYITGLHKEGEFLGYTALFEDSDYTESAIAFEDATVQIIPREDFLALIYSNREVSNKFIKMLSKNLQEREEQLLNLAYNSVRKRVAEGLLLLKKKYGNNENEIFNISISRDDLAGIVGTSTESVIRTLSDFKDENLIEIKASNITIKNPEKLSRLVN